MAVPPTWHFDGWHKSVGLILRNEEKLDQTSQEFFKLESNIERVKYMWKIKCVHRTLKMAPNYTAKSAEKAERMRTAGNKAFIQKNYRSAFDLYNAAICFSPVHESVTLALSYANRSAVCFHENNYEQALLDINSALEEKYPEKLHYKLYERAGKCYKHIGQQHQAKENFEKAKEYLKYAELSEDKIKHIQKTINRELKKFVFDGESGQLDVPEKSPEKERKCDSLNEKTFGPPPTHLEGTNETFVSLASYCDVEYQPEFGRYIVAKRDIKPGEIVLIEKPYASVSLSDYIKTHCHHCYSRLYAMYPCKNCASAIFCSENCANAAWDNYHKIECEYLDFVRQSRIGVFGMIALRAVSCTPVEKMVDLMESQKSESGPQVDPRLAGCDFEGKYKPDDYDTMVHLVGHTEDRTIEDLFRRTLQAVMLLKVLAETEYFDTTKAADTYDLKMFVGSMLLDHLQSFPCNAHEIPELQLNMNSVCTSESYEMGGGIYSTLSLFNHSCNPAVNRNFYGDVCVVRAIRPIKEGEEISDNYGAVNAVQSKQERMDKLKTQYYFECNCEACVNDWPLYHSIQDGTHVWKCHQCNERLGINLPNKTKCRKCGKMHNIEEYEKELAVSMTGYHDAMQKLLDKANIEDTLSVFLERLALLDKYLIPPFRPFNDCQEALKQCFAIMGNCYRYYGWI